MKSQSAFKTIALSLLFSSATLLNNAQAPNIQWQKTIGGAGDDANNFGKITSLKDGNYLLVGETNSTSINGKAVVNRGDFDAVVIKFKASGKIIWAKTYGGSLEDYLFNY